MASGYYYDPGRAPPAAYWPPPQPYPGSAPPSQHGYPPPPRSPTGYPPMSPMRSHTAYPPPSQYPPPSSGSHPYQYGHPPPGHGSAPPSAPPPPASEAPATSAPESAPTTTSAPATENKPASGLVDVNNLGPDDLKAILEQLSKHRLGPQTTATPPTPSASTSAASPPFPTPTSSQAPHHPPPQSHALPPPAHGHYPGYPYPYPPYSGPPPSSQGDHERDPRRHPGYPNPGPGGPDLNMPGAFVPEAPAPPPSSKTPAPRPERQERPERPEPSRKPSHQASEFSYASSTDFHPAREMWGKLVRYDRSRDNEPCPEPKLQGLYKGIAKHIIEELEPRDSLVVTIPKLVEFYKLFTVEGEDWEKDWRDFLLETPPPILSTKLVDLRVEHHLVPTERCGPPVVPALTYGGFETWMFTVLMAFPDREARRLAKVVETWRMFDARANDFIPSVLPRECFPPERDETIYRGWMEIAHDVYDDLSDDEGRPPRMLPEAPYSAAPPPAPTPAPPPPQAQSHHQPPPPQDLREPPRDPREPPRDPREPPRDLREPPRDPREPPRDPREPPRDPREPPRDPREPPRRGRGYSLREREPPRMSEPLSPPIRDDRPPPMREMPPPMREMPPHMREMPPHMREKMPRDGMPLSMRDHGPPTPPAAPPKETPPTPPIDAAPPPPAAGSPDPPPLTRKRTSRPYGMTNIPVDEFMPADKPSVESPTTERYRAPYAAAPNPGWREELNPRPTLGEEAPPGRPPTRARSTKGLRTSSSAAPPPKPRRGRSVRPSRRDYSPQGRYYSDEEDDIRPDPYARPGRYEGELYDDPSPPPLRATTPHGSRYHAREPSRGPPLRGRDRPPKEDLSAYSYQDQYEREAGHSGKRERRSGRWA